MEQKYGLAIQEIESAQDTLTILSLERDKARKEAGRLRADLEEGELRARGGIVFAFASAMQEVKRLKMELAESKDSVVLWQKQAWRAEERADAYEAELGKAYDDLVSAKQASGSEGGSAEIFRQLVALKAELARNPGRATDLRVLELERRLEEKGPQGAIPDDNYESQAEAVRLRERVAELSSDLTESNRLLGESRREREGVIQRARRDMHSCKDVIRDLEARITAHVAGSSDVQVPLSPLSIGSPITPHAMPTHKAPLIPLAHDDEGWLLKPPGPR